MLTMKANYTAKERRAIYEEALSNLQERHYSAPFLCHLLSYILSGNLQVKCYTLKSILPEFRMLEPIPGDTDSGDYCWWDYGIRDKYRWSARETALLFMIQMTYDKL